ncbi:MAG: hypothetical protein IM653_12440 [Phenylobacterium sp.]|uniref:DUF6249 domain-containing protein n=1 Tax=Phenylobacterium sp. TaxID=1871053 RepID=UPI0025FBEA99|nr:DUF6249 domain-containing protein [Phenylobacterium sp.]MCA6223333.1 hypothetical protein [Phenylobacterium sp.]MCA6225495.1 hypothetical protein [Phenylobacterium sp.]MCA6233206.1 hypothetical protein [Phenylobacterium sp.]MCA6235927.1 hypothetical protein [Phenylobacterium sp.]MCA6248605.1 hypothetical protein [Phenylobacterium sp.]
MSSESIESSLQFFLLMSFLAAVVLGSQYFQGRRRARIHETIELAIRQGQPVPPELLELLARREGNTKPPSDLRWGLIAVSVGVGLAIFGQIMGSIDAEARTALTGAAAIPGCIGVAGILLHLLGRKSS